MLTDNHHGSESAGLATNYYSSAYMQVLILDSNQLVALPHDLGQLVQLERLSVMLSLRCLTAFASSRNCHCWTSRQTVSLS